MSGSIWLEMPAEIDSARPTRSAPKYPIGTSAILVYRGTKAYALLDDAERDELRHHPDVRYLTPRERRDLEAANPAVRILAAAREGVEDVGTVQPGLGDAVARLTSALGFSECASCSARRSRLNQLRLPAWRRRDRRVPVPR